MIIFLIRIYDIGLISQIVCFEYTFIIRKDLAHWTFFGQVFINNILHMNLTQLIILRPISAWIRFKYVRMSVIYHIFFNYSFTNLFQIAHNCWRLLWQNVDIILIKVFINNFFAVLVNSVDGINNCFETLHSVIFDFIELALKHLCSDQSLFVLFTSVNFLADWERNLVFTEVVLNS